MIKRLLVIILCIFLTGCSNSDKGIIRLKFSTWGSASEMKILSPIISEYERQNPNIKIELLHIPQDYFKKLHLLFASNLEPDIVFINNLNLPVYSDRLLELSEHINKNEFYPQSIDALSVNNKLYAIPRDVSILVVFYNKNLFNKFGIKYPDKNWSINDLENTAKNLSQNGYFGIGYDNNIYPALPFINSFGGDILNKDGLYIADNKEFKNGIEYYKNLAYKNHYAPTKPQIGSKMLSQMFLEGKIGMHVSGRWMVPKYRESAKFDWDIVNFPNCASPSDASGWAVSKSSKHKKEALDFVLYLSTKNNISKMAESGLIIPARYDVAQSETFLNGKPKHSDLFLHAIKYSHNTYVNKNYIKDTDILNDKYFQD